MHKQLTPLPRAPRVPTAKGPGARLKHGGTFPASLQLDPQDLLLGTFWPSQENLELKPRVHTDPISNPNSFVAQWMTSDKLPQFSQLKKEDNDNKLHFMGILYGIKFARIEFKNAAVRQADLDSNGYVVLHKPLYLSGPQAS